MPAYAMKSLPQAGTVAPGWAAATSAVAPAAVPADSTSAAACAPTLDTPSSSNAVVVAGSGSGLSRTGKKAIDKRKKREQHMRKLHEFARELRHKLKELGEREIDCLATPTAAEIATEEKLAKREQRMTERLLSIEKTLNKYYNNQLPTTFERRAVEDPLVIHTTGCAALDAAVTALVNKVPEKPWLFNPRFRFAPQNAHFSHVTVAEIVALIDSLRGTNASLLPAAGDATTERAEAICRLVALSIRRRRMSDLAQSHADWRDALNDANTTTSGAFADAHETDEYRMPEISVSEAMAKESVEEFLTLSTEQSHEGDDGDSTGTSGDGDHAANSDDMEEQDSASVSLADSDGEDEQRVLDEGEGGKDGESGGDRDGDFIVLNSDDGGEEAEESSEDAESGDEVEARREDGAAAADRPAEGQENGAVRDGRVEEEDVITLDDD